MSTALFANAQTIKTKAYKETTYFKADTITRALLIFNHKTKKYNVVEGKYIFGKYTTSYYDYIKGKKIIFKIENNEVPLEFLDCNGKSFKKGNTVILYDEKHSIKY